MRRFFIGGNWKCNNKLAQTQSLITDVVNKLAFNTATVEVVVSPTLVHLHWVQQHVQRNVQVAAQNSSLTKFGAYTGETSYSVEHLKDLGIPWVILGHSERRQFYGESNKIVGQKVRLALDNGVRAIACFGEKLEERDAGKTIQVVQEQLTAIKAELTNEHWKDVVLAYEPIWAIGTGKTASPEQAQEVHAFIRSFLTQNLSKEISNTTRVIYGGSVTEKNAKDLVKQPDVDGFLVGGASLKPAFADIVEACNKGR